MATLFEQYYGNLLADLAYEDLGQIGPNQVLGGAALIAKLDLSSRFTADQARAIADRFEIVATAGEGSFQAIAARELQTAVARPGMPAESGGYGRSPGRIWVAFRGTEIPDDLLSDAAMVLSGAAGFQDMAAKRFIEKLSDPVGGYGLIGPSTQFNVTGHSLGGHLALNVARVNEPRIHQVFTVNTANVGGTGAFQLRERLERLLPGDAFELLSDRITNIQAIPGLQVAGSFLTGIRAGQESLMMTEAASSPLFSLPQHYIGPLTDAFDVARVLAAASVGISNETITQLINAASTSRPTSLESVLAPIWRAVHPSEVYPIAMTSDTNLSKDADNQFHLTAERLFRELAAVPGSYQIVSMVAEASSLVALAMQSNSLGTAVRVALVNGDPYAVVSPSYPPGYELESFSPEYLVERAEFLVHLLSAQISELSGQGENGIHLSFRGSGYYAEDTAIIDGGAVNRRVASNGTVISLVDIGVDIDRHIFGTSGGDILVGQDGDDKIFGGAGVDVLEGGDGDDLLDGGGGSDSLTGGAGRNTLIGGEGFDNYFIATGAGTTTIRDSDGLGMILIQDQNGWHSLGEELRGMNGAAGMAVDSNFNTYRLSGVPGAGALTVKTRDGRSIIIENYYSGSEGGGTNAGSLQSLRGVSASLGESTNDGPGGSTPLLGITMPSEEERSPFPTTADFVFAPTTLTNGSVWSVGTGLNTGSYFGLNSSTNDHSELLDISGLVIPPRPHFYVYGSFGDTFVRGMTNASNLIIDDYYRTHLVNVIGESVGNDFIEGGNVSDYIFTKGGDDQVYGGGGTDIITDRPEGWTEFGTVAWVNAPGHSNRDQLFGEAGNDLIAASAGDGFLSGGDGGDVLLGGAHSDTILGGTGNDFLSGDTKHFSYLLDYTQMDVWLNFQNLTGELEYFGADILDGGEGQDVLIGGGGADALYGGEDNDVLMGDLVILDPQGSWTWESAPGGNAWTWSYATILAEHEFDPDSIHGADVLYGDGGNDFLFGGGLSDELHGGEGDDVVYGENQGSGTASEAAIAVAFHGADRIFGEGGNDVLYGNSGDDFIDGGDGNDVLVGDSSTNTAETGNDELRGGAGVDLIIGNGGDDRIYGDSGGDDLQGGAGNDSVSGGDGDDNIHGDSGDDTLEGGGGIDAIGGDDGNDTLISGAGGDSLFGGAGNDTFVLRVGSGATYIGDDSGSTVVKFDGAIRREEVRVEAGTYNGGQSVRIFYGATDYAYLTTTDFDRINRFEFADGTTLTRNELLLAYQPPAANLGDGKVHLNVDSSLVTLHADGSNLLLHYAGGNSGWANTGDLTSKGVLWSKNQAGDYGLGSGEVLVLKNWYTAEFGSSVSVIEGQFGEAVDLGFAALNLSRTQQATAATPYAVGNGGNDTLLGSDSNDTVFGGAGNDILDGGSGSDILCGETGDDTYVIRPVSGMDFIAESEGSDTLRFKDGILSTDVAFREINGGLEVVIGDPANENRAVVAGWFDDPNKRIEQFVFEGDSVTWSSVDVEARITGNRRPIVASSLNDSLLVSETPFSFSVPSNAFVDPNPGDTVTFSAVAGSGSELLPGWLAFDPVTRTFSGTAPAGNGSEAITVYATDARGLFASVALHVNLDKMPWLTRETFTAQAASFSRC